MSVPLRIIEYPDAGEFQHRRCRPDLTPGAMWREPHYDRQGREAWAIVLPTHDLWWTTMEAGQPRGFWDISGIPPHITISPSIDMHGPGGHWHGWIRNGGLVDA